MLMAMINICALTLAALAYLAKERNLREFSLQKSYIYSFGAYCALAARRWWQILFKGNHQTIDHRWSVTPVNIAVRIAFFTILICGCLIFWHWKAGLISNLSVVKFTTPFNSLEELLLSDLKVYKCCLPFNETISLKKTWYTSYLGCIAWWILLWKHL